MNPEHLRARDYEVRLLPNRGEGFQAARQFVADHHYSKGCSNTSVYSYGLYRCGHTELLGVAMWLPPTKCAAKSVNENQWQRVLSLTRLALHPSVPTNAATFLMARSIRQIRADGRFCSLVTYADEFCEHTGAIYRGANWSYVGTTGKQPRWEDADGRQVAPKSTVNRTKAEMEALGYRKVGSYRKHKFVMHLRIQQKPLRFVNDNAILWFAVAV